MNNKGNNCGVLDDDETDMVIDLPSFYSEEGKGNGFIQMSNCKYWCLNCLCKTKFHQNNTKFFMRFL